MKVKKGRYQEMSGQKSKYWNGWVCSSRILLGGQTKFWETMTFPQGEEESRGEGGRAKTRGGEGGK